MAVHSPSYPQPFTLTDSYPRQPFQEVYSDSGSSSSNRSSPSFQDPHVPSRDSFRHRRSHLEGVELQDMEYDAPSGRHRKSSS